METEINVLGMLHTCFPCYNKICIQINNIVNNHIYIIYVDINEKYFYEYCSLPIFYARL